MIYDCTGTRQYGIYLSYVTKNFKTVNGDVVSGLSSNRPYEGTNQNACINKLKI